MTGSRARRPAGCPSRSTGASSTGCTPACANGWSRWPPTRTTRPGSSSSGGSPGSPTASRPPPSCASAGSASSARCWAAPGSGTGPRPCGRKPRTRCGPRPPTRSLSCAAGWPTLLVATGGRLGSDPRLAGRPGAPGRVRGQGARRPVPRRARRPRHGHHRAVGRRRDVQPAGTAPRARSAVHPDQRHGGGGRRGAGLARHRPGAGLTEAPAGPARRLAHAGTTYGKSSLRCCWVTERLSPLGTAVPATRDSMASGALSAWVRPLSAAKPKMAGVPTT